MPATHSKNVGRTELKMNWYSNRCGYKTGHKRIIDQKHGLCKLICAEFHKTIICQLKNNVSVMWRGWARCMHGEPQINIKGIYLNEEQQVTSAGLRRKSSTWAEVRRSGEQTKLG